MKKIILSLIILFSLSGKAQTGAATQSLQTKGNNTLTNIYNLLNAGSTNTLSITNSVVTTSVTVPAGAYKVECLTSSAFTGSLNGTSFDPSLYVPFGNIPNHYLPSITCTATTGSITIIVTK